jgi:hypothetical protein
MIRLAKWAPICLSLEGVAVHAGHKVLEKVDGNISLLACDPLGILCQHLRPHPIYLINIIMIKLFDN